MDMGRERDKNNGMREIKCESSGDRVIQSQNIGMVRQHDDIRDNEVGGE